MSSSNAAFIKETLFNTRFLVYHISLAFVGMSPFSPTNPVLWCPPHLTAALLIPAS